MVQSLQTLSKKTEGVYVHVTRTERESQECVAHLDSSTRDRLCQSRDEKTRVRQKETDPDQHTSFQCVKGKIGPFIVVREKNRSQVLTEEVVFIGS